MALIKHTGVIRWDLHKLLPKGVYAVEADKFYRDKLKIPFKKILEAEKKAGKSKSIMFNLEWFSKKRTLAMNSLVWGLYDIEVNEINNGDNYGQGSITTEELYKQDLIDHAEIITLICSASSLPRIRNEYHHIIEFKEHPNEEKKELFIIRAYESSSMMDIKKMHSWIERIFNRISENGISVGNSADMLVYWKNWRENLNDKKTILHTEEMTEKQYKALFPMCEACGAYIANGGGSLAHIKARGMGGNPEEYKQLPSNWLHLCDPDHALFDNGGGRVEFLKKYRHLKYKVEQALRRKVERVEPVKEEPKTEEPGGENVLPIF